MNEVVVHDTSTVLLMQYCIIFLIVIIIAIIGLVLYIKRNNRLMSELLNEQNHEDFQEFKETIANMNKGLVDEIVDVLKDDGEHSHSDKQEKLKDHQEELLNTFAKLRRVIKDDLYATMHHTGACRTALYLFHNGTRSTEGISFLKISCIGERTLVGSGVKEQILNHSNMPVNIFDNMYDKLIENGRYVVMNDEKTMQTSRAQFISASKIRYSQAIGIYDSSNNILGFVLAEFDHAYNKAASDTEYAVLKDFTKKISPILSFSEYADLTLKTKTENTK